MKPQLYARGFPRIFLPIYREPLREILAQVALGIGAGIVGIMLAAPLVAVAIVLVRRLWIPSADVSGRP